MVRDTPSPFPPVPPGGRGNPKDGFDLTSLLEGRTPPAAPPAAAAPGPPDGGDLSDPDRPDPPLPFGCRVAACSAAALVVLLALAAMFNCR